MTEHSLADLGWSDFFARQVTEAEAHLAPMRIATVHRTRVEAIGPNGAHTLIPDESAGAYAVGDWVLSDGGHALRRLDPVTDLARRAAGPEATAQRIAANVDTIGIVTSCNADFNVARLERYLALVSSSGALPLVILTKADLATDARDMLRQAERISPLVTALSLNATDPEEAERLTPWCSDGRTLALVGMSGVGKTTLRNALTGGNAETQAIREDDARGRHTTTGRELVATRAGGWLIDTPGMRELQLTGSEEGIAAVFDDIDALAAACRFGDCAHESEPGCAVRAAVDAGTLEPERFARWQKLAREDAHNSASLAQKRARGKAFARQVKGVKALKRTRRGEG